MSASPAKQVVLVRHGETEWARVGKHTGRTDIPLTDLGREQAEVAGRRLKGRSFAMVLTSPLSRAADTCRIAGFGDVASVDDDLMEWDYGDYEGRKTVEIREERPGWSLWKDGVPKGESGGDVAARVDRVIERALSIDGDALLFAHGHLLRVLAARWLGLGFDGGRLLSLSPATLSVLGFERENRVLLHWNDIWDSDDKPYGMDVKG